jgi:predicted nucleic acid-binding protein
MFLLDTNVVSEFRKLRTKRENKNVAAWSANISVNALYISAITVCELEMGVISIERKDITQGAILRSWLESHVLPTFNERTLYFDTAVARCCAKLHVPDKQAAHDAMIAATALVHGLTVVTRNVDDFKKTGVEIINPWDA